MDTNGSCICAVLKTQCGDLAIYDCDALAKIVSVLPQGADLRSTFDWNAPPAPPPIDTLDGFTIAEWAAYGELKAEIASRTCRQNGP